MFCLFYHALHLNNRFRQQPKSKGRTRFVAKNTVQTKKAINSPKRKDPFTLALRDSGTLTSGFQWGRQKLREAEQRQEWASYIRQVEKKMKQGSDRREKSNTNK